MFEAIQFSTLSEFFDMGGYGFNVWSVYALFTIFIGANLIMPMRKRQSIIKEQKRRLLVNRELRGEIENNNEDDLS